MSSSNSSIEKGPSKSYKYDCLDCENYKRKVVEAQQTVSGRDVLIEMLQGEIKKLEERYKTSIDDYELLRFKYCTVVQELSSLKEIQAKIEKTNLKLIKERDVAKKQLELLQNEVLETCKNQCKEVTIELIPTEGVEMTPSNKDNSLHQNILKEVMNIEVIMQNQNETVKDVLMKVLNEMQCGKVSDQIEESLQKAVAYNVTHNTEENQTQNKENLLAVIEELANQVETLKAENESIKAQLKEKKSNLAQCLDVLEDNHSNLNNISGNIEVMINEKKTYIKEIEQLNNIIKENSLALKKKNEEIFDLRNKLEFVSQKSEADLTKENTALRKALNKTERELEQLQENYLQRAYECTNEKCKTLGEVMVQAISRDGGIKKVKESEARNTDGREMHENEDEDKIRAVQYEVEIAVLHEKINSLEQNLEQAKLEINEYEEENKSYSQKVDSLVMHLQILEKEKETKCNDNLNKSQEKELKDQIAHMEENLKVTNLEKVKLIEEKEYLENLIVNLQSEIIYLQHNDIVDQYEVEIAAFKKKVKILDQNLEEAKLEINKYKEENKNYSQKVNSLVMHLQTLQKEKETRNNDNSNKDQDKDKIAQIEENFKTTNHEKTKLIEEKEYLKNQIVNLQTEIMYKQEKDEIMQEKIKQLEKLQYEDEKENGKMSRLLQEKDYFKNQMITLQEELMKKQKDEKQILMLQENLKAANREIAKLFEEKEMLKKQSVSLQNEVIRMQEKDEKQILKLQEKIDNLENAQNEKQKEIDQCCCVIKNIKATIDDKHIMEENSFAQITFLKDQNEQLQQQICILKRELMTYQEKFKGCSCTNADISTEMEDENKKLKQQINVLRSELAAYEHKYKDCNCTQENISNEINLRDVNQKLQEQNKALRSELVDYQNKYEGCNCIPGTSGVENNFDLLSSKLQNEIKELETELCQRECITEKLQNDIKDMEIEICRRQCTINHLEQCLDKSNKILAECEKEMKEMHADNESLKKQNELLNNNIKDYIFETKRTSAEKEVLEDKFAAASRKSQALELEKYQLSKNLHDKSNIEDELNQLRKRYDNLLKTAQEKDNELKGAKKNIESLQEALESSKKEYDKIMKAYKEVKDTLSEEIKKYNEEVKEKDNELKGAKKNIESLQEALESSRKEHDKIMKAYKEAKDTLSEEIKKYNEEAKRMDKEKDIIEIDLKQEAKCSACLNVKELTAIIMEKQKTIKALEEQNRELISEELQLKAYISKLISDNKNLRMAIDNLLASLTEKLKVFTENEENNCPKSNEVIVREILNSLIDLEKNIIESSTCKERCNCMSVIKSTYKIDSKDPKARKLSPCKEKCGKRKSGSKCNIISDACVECCQGREKGQDDKPEAYSYGTSNRYPEDS